MPQKRKSDTVTNPYAFAPASLDGQSTHPAYAVISAARVSGRAMLYGSDAEHHHFVKIAISRSSVQRDLSRDFVGGGEQLIEIAMSEAQWATFVSTLNVGIGTQCTLTWFDGEYVQSILELPNRTNQFSSEMRVTMDDGLAKLKDLRAKIEASTMRVGEKGLALKDIDKAIQEISKNTVFVADQFVRHMDDVSAKAKSEVAAFLQAMIVKAGRRAVIDGPSAIESLDTPGSNG